jgi:hypothetical protein
MIRKTFESSKNVYFIHVGLVEPDQMELNNCSKVCCKIPGWLLEVDLDI